MSEREPSMPALAVSGKEAASSSIETPRTSLVPALSGTVPDLGPVYLRTPSLPPSARPRTPVVRPRVRVQWTRFIAVVGATTVLMVAGVATAWATHLGVQPQAEPPPSPDLEPVPATSPIIRPLLAAPPVRALRGARRGVVPGPAAARTLANAHVVAAPQHTAPASAPVPPAHVPSGSCSQQCNGNIDCILHCPTSATAPAAGAMPAVPTREQVSMAVHGVRGAVMLCGMALPATAPSSVPVTLVFASSGRIDNVEVGGPYAGTSPGACVAQAVQRARVPEFSQSSFRVTFPFTIH